MSSLVAALLAAWAVPCGASDLASHGLVGLHAVRVQVLSSNGLDPVDVEVAVLKRLASRGIGADPAARAVLTVDAHTGEDVASAGVSLLQNMVLERDPLWAAEVPTWSMGEAARLGGNDDPNLASLRLLDRVMDQFLTAWSDVNL